MTLDPTAVALGLLGGGALGVLFFGGLWLTIGRAVRSSRPHAWLWWSAAVRFAAAVAAFYGLSLLGPEALPASTAGFLAARQGWLAVKRNGPQSRRVCSRGERTVST